MSTIQDAINQMVDEYERGEMLFSSYIPNIEVRPSGPKIRRQVKYDPATDSRDVWQQQEDAYWRFKELAKRLEPLLEQCGETLVNTVGATPDGRVLFWALDNEYPPPSQINTAPNVDAFFVVRMKLREIVTAPTKPKRKRHSNEQWDEWLSDYESECEDNPDMTETDWANAQDLIPNTVSKAFCKARERREALRVGINKANTERAKTRPLD